MNSNFSSITRSLYHRNFRIFFIGQLVSLIGTWITSIASSWLVYRLTGSSLLLGSFTAAGLLPTIVVTPFAGVKLDRWDRRKVLMATQAASMVQSLVLAFLTLTGWITIPELFALTVVQGIINGFDMPARQAFLSEIVESREQLANAIALNSSMFNGARLIGPAIGGVIISLSNEGVCFLIDGLTYLAVLVSLFRIRIRESTEVPKGGGILSELLNGLSYARGFAPIGSLLLMVAATSFGMAPYISLLPAFARECLNGGADLLGLLMACSGLGALSGSLYLASRRSILGLGKVIVFSGIFLAVGLSALAMSTNLYQAAPSLFIVGTAMILLLSSCNTILQTLVAPEMRGRIMSLYTSGFTGMVPLGSLAAGFLATHIGVRAVIGLGGSFILGAALLLKARLPLLQEQARPVLIERGIIFESQS